MTGAPALASISTNVTLSGASTRSGSFCSPSRGPTSTMVTRRGIAIVRSFQIDEWHARLHELAGLTV